MNEQVEELLERLWVLEEEDGEKGIQVERLNKELEIGNQTLNGPSGGFFRRRRRCRLDCDLGTIESEGLITISDGRVYLADGGKKVARKVIRNHRLAEVLLMEIFEVADDEAHSSACKFEHILSPQVTDKVCTFLGHPPTCPHGKVIPRGGCCKIFGTHIEPLVKPLTNLSVGKRARIVFIAPSFKTRLERLGSLGLIPGGVLKLKQRHPSYVVEIDETTVALDKDVGKEIFVREVS
jgi:DtxR family Mn-dependent transcriptional regulator